MAALLGVVNVPFASTMVVPDGWAAAHAPVAEATHTASCRIVAPVAGAGGWDPATGPTTDSAGATLYSGPCRVQELTGSDHPTDVAGQPVADYPYLVAISSTAADIPPMARLTVDACPNDPRLVGKVLTVRVSRYASLRIERHLSCSLDPGNQP